MRLKQLFNEIIILVHIFVYKSITNSSSFTKYMY